MSANPYTAVAEQETPLASPPRRFPWMAILVAFGIAGVFVLLMLPAVRSPREAARRTQCKNNLKQISLALLNYADDYGAFPPAFTVDSDGKQLHSWRTLILPYLEQRSLYDSIDLSKPWNHVDNKSARETEIWCFSCPSADLSPHHTTYFGVVGEEFTLHPDRPRAIKEFTGGTTNALMVVEVSPENSVHWMMPEQAGADLFIAMNEDTSFAHEGGVQGALADGSVRFISARVSAAARQQLLSVSESVSAEF